MSSFSEFEVIHSEAQRQHKFSWQQTMLRIKDPKVSVPFYEKNFGFKLIHKYDFPQWNFGLYFMAILPELEDAIVNVPNPIAGTTEAEEYLWAMSGTCLELTHNYGTENDENFKVNNGNVEPHRGFGHIAVMCKDVYASCEELEANGVLFQKKPDEGRMKGLAFALDPDGYWIEVVKRTTHTSASASTIESKYTFAQTMKRIKDPVKSLRFYRDVLGMTLIKEAHMGVGEDWGFSLYFLASVPEGTVIPSDRNAFIDGMFGPVLELTHNHGTEHKPEFKYHNGNDQEENQLRGFGHIGFLVENLESACDYLESTGYNFKKKPQDGGMKEIAFVYDPDNYWVEIIQKNGLRLTTSKN